MGINRSLKRALLTIMVLIIMVTFLPLSHADSKSKEAKVQQPVIGARGAVVYCENTGETVFSKQDTVQFNPSDTALLMTALMVVQNVPLDQEVVISKSAAAQQGKKMDLKAGEKLTVKDLLYGVLLTSANDAAYALGERVSGSASAFQKKMNQTAKNLGCKDTTFGSVSGYPLTGSRTTAKDSLQILRVALSNDTIRKISESKSFVIRDTNKHEKRVLKNNLSMLNVKDSGIYGGKSGEEAGNASALAAGYQNNGLELYIVLLGESSGSMASDVKKLTEYAAKVTKGVHVVKAGVMEGKVRIRHGAKTRLETYTQTAGDAFLPKEGSKDLISTKVVMKTDVTAPVKAGDVVGYLYISVGDDVTNQVPLIVKESVEEGWLPSYIGISNLATVIIVVLLLALTIFLLWLSSVRRRARRRRERMRRRMIREIAEQRYLDEQDHERRDWTFK